MHIPNKDLVCKALSQGFIISEDVVPPDITRAYNIYGPNAEELKGSKTKRKATPIPQRMLTSFSPVAARNLLLSYNPLETQLGPLLAKGAQRLLELQ